MYLFRTNASRPQQAYRAGDHNPTHPTSRLKLNCKKTKLNRIKSQYLWPKMLLTVILSIEATHAFLITKHLFDFEDIISLDEEEFFLTETVSLDNNNIDIDTPFG